MRKLFDLNIEQVLEHWELEHAVREIIANALDEKTLTKTKEIEVYLENEIWHIRDYGRGLKPIHLTQNENKEKVESPFLIGKFGVGLKDALAVLFRKDIRVEINSKYAHITLEMATKNNFEIETLHAVFSEPTDPNMQGTEFLLFNIGEEVICKAKSMFLYFNNDMKLLEKSNYGEVYLCKDSIKSIYINGVQVASEENFLFSYNITNINSQIKKHLNRERSNVGRTAYSDTIKNILTKCKSEEVLFPLVDDLRNIMLGNNRDESAWTDVATYAAKFLNKSGDYVFMTPWQRNELTNQQVEILEQSGKKIVMITDTVYSKINKNVTTFLDVYAEYEKGFEYKFVNISILTPKEKKIYNLKDKVISFLKRNNYMCNAKIKISEHIRLDSYGNDTLGVWDSNEKAIIIKRSVLSSETDFLGILLHEFAHFHSGYEDNTREFEGVLTEMLGYSLSEIK